MIAKQLCNVGFYSNVRYEFCAIQLAWIDCDNVNVHRAVPILAQKATKLIKKLETIMHRHVFRIHLVFLERQTWLRLTWISDTTRLTLDASHKHLRCTLLSLPSE